MESTKKLNQPLNLTEFAACLTKRLISTHVLKNNDYNKHEGLFLQGNEKL
jgi:hypothetical protein